MEASDMEPIIIAENVLLEAYIKFCKTKQKLPVSIHFVDGKVIAYEVLLSNHAKVAYRVAYLVENWNNRLIGMTGKDLIVSQNTPAGQQPNSDGRAYPIMVVEVGNSESLSSLHSPSTYYFSPQTTIQIYLVIKLFPIRQDDTRVMLALRYLCTNQNQMVPDVVISFGTVPLHGNTMDFLLNNVGVPSVNITGVGFTATTCNAPGIPNYQLHIPAVELFNGSPSGVPARAINGFYLDLWELQNLKNEIVKLKRAVENIEKQNRTVTNDLTPQGLLSQKSSEYSTPLPNESCSNGENAQIKDSSTHHEADQFMTSTDLVTSEQVVNTISNTSNLNETAPENPNH
ncbi:2812_t:CDS:2 [Acaulospora morrowiae]|uniref:2812_t:CDS:1 n=1 Tax=Acaulospora morrowiae TaxID=94023 RepID=A0A9N9DSW5_9GLOM|nr:2812_t:CDS:2 [Acaulospora morrowiae]